MVITTMYTFKIGAFEESCGFNSFEEMQEYREHLANVHHVPAEKVKVLVLDTLY